MHAASRHGTRSLTSLPKDDEVSCDGPAFIFVDFLQICFNDPPGSYFVKIVYMILKT